MHSHHWAALVIVSAPGRGTETSSRTCQLLTRHFPPPAAHTREAPSDCSQRYITADTQLRLAITQQNNRHLAVASPYGRDWLPGERSYMPTLTTEDSKHHPHICSCLNEEGIQNLLKLRLVEANKWGDVTCGWRSWCSRAHLLMVYCIVSLAHVAHDHCLLKGTESQEELPQNAQR